MPTPTARPQESPPPPDETWRELRYIGAFWLVFTVITVVQRALTLGARRGMEEVAAAAIVALLESAMWAAVTVFVFRWVERNDEGEESRAQTLQRLALIGVGITLVTAAIGTGLRFAFHLLPPDVSAGRAFRFGISFGAVTSMIIVTGIGAAAFARVFSRQARLREQQAVRLEAQLAGAQLDALRRQLDPHFLFNTLSLISALADSDPKGVRRMIARLSDLLRFSLEGAESAEVPLRKELDLLDRYLDIMRMRFDGRLQVEVRTDDGALDALVPSLILQPLVENAMRHGVEKVRGMGVVAIEARVDGALLVLRVVDNGPAWTSQAPSHEGGVGLRNTRARLQQLYGDRGSFSLREGEGGGTVAEVRFPLTSPAVLRTREVHESPRHAHAHP